MKQTIHILTLLLLAVNFLAPAQILRIADNNPSAPTGANIYATAQGAIDAANPGDVIQIVPSATNYGDFTVDKLLTIYGVGYNPNKALPYTSNVNDINLQGTAASGSLISGLIGNQIHLATNTGSTYTQSNVTIESNRLFRVDQNVSNTVQNLIVRNNIVFGGGNPTLTIALAIDDKLVNAVIANNIIHGSGGILLGGVSAGNFTSIRNNLFYGSNLAAWRAFHEILNCIVTNNIFYGRGPAVGLLGLQDLNVFSNNLSFTIGDNTLPPVANGIGNTGIDNIENMDPLFVNVPFASGIWDVSYDPTLQVGSPALGAGTGGEDLGILDGPYPFSNISTGTGISVVQQFNTSGLVNQGETLKVNIQAASSN